MSGLWRSRLVQWWLPIAIAIVVGGATLIFGLKDVLGWYYYQTGIATLGGFAGFLVGAMQVIVVLLMIVIFVGGLFGFRSLEDRDIALAYFYIGAALLWWPVIACWVAALFMAHDPGFATGLIKSRFWIVACGFAVWMSWEFSSDRHLVKSGKPAA